MTHFAGHRSWAYPPYHHVLLAALQFIQAHWDPLRVTPRLKAPFPLRQERVLSSSVRAFQPRGTCFSCCYSFTHALRRWQRHTQHMVRALVIQAGPLNSVTS